MDLGSILLGAALLLLVAFIVAQPLLRKAAPRDTQPDEAEALLFERERVLAALQDLEFDHATGKLLAEDYAAQRAQLLAEGARVLRQLDAAAPTTERGSIDEEIERAVARRRAAGAAPKAALCGQCGRAARPDDQFCGACGAPLGEPAAAAPQRR